MAKPKQPSSRLHIILISLILVVASANLVFFLLRSTDKTSSLDNASDLRQTSANGELMIKQWGVKLKLDPKLGKVSYTYQPNVTGHAFEGVRFRSELEKDGLSDWGISRFPSNANEGKVYAFMPPVRKVAFGNYFFRLDGPLSASDDASQVVEDAYLASFGTLAGY